MDRETRQAAIAAACILLIFGLLAFFMPNIMLAVGAYSTAVAGVIAVLFVVGFFALFWLRGKSRGG
ncbi:MAG: hypothetical protein KF874_11155 [Rhizobiaceae bacterium]|nr:hypothetical protein [Rhizobiaceae bacterium]